MGKNRTQRLNSLLQEVIMEVIRKEVRNPHINEFVSVTHVEITKDLRHAKVFISVIGTELQKKETLEALQSAASFIAISASKKMVIRYFPALAFKLDDSVEQQLRIHEVIGKLQTEREMRLKSQESHLPPDASDAGHSPS